MNSFNAFMVGDDKIRFPDQGESHGTDEPAADADVLAVRLDMETTGLFVACAGSAVNYAARHPHLATGIMAALPAWLPSMPVSVRRAQAELVRDGIPVSVCSAVRDLGLHLKIATKATRQHCDMVARRVSVSPAAIDDLVGLWGPLAERAMALLQTLGALTPSRSDKTSKSEEATASVERLLAATALGDWPCITERGAIAVPGWLERRRERRYHLRLDCHVIETGRTWLAQTFDISLSGIGLSSAPPLSPGSRATVRLGALSEISGKVAWTRGDRMGFQFDRPLTTLAPLGRSILSD